MKCPFRTIITKTNTFTNAFSPKFERIKSTTEDIEFKDCLEGECPYCRYFDEAWECIKTKRC